MDNEGKMTNIGKEKGSNKAIKKLIEYFDELSEDIYNHRVIIGHSDSYEKAKK